MKYNTLGIQYNQESRSVNAQARLLMSQSRQKQQNRQKSMLHRASSEIGIDE